LLIENKRCQPPLEEREVRVIARSISEKAVHSGAQGDLAERAMSLMLAREFRDGEHLTFCTDGRFWMYNGKCWLPVQESWLRGKTLAALSRTCRIEAARIIGVDWPGIGAPESKTRSEWRSASFHRCAATGDQLLKR
jgi:hypothetical protein